MLLTVGCDDEDDYPRGIAIGSDSIPPLDEVFSDEDTCVPETLVVSSGAEMKWTNRSGFVQTATGGTPGNQSGPLNSSTIGQGLVVTYAFTQPGTHNCFCTIHPGEHTGVVIVN